MDLRQMGVGLSERESTRSGKKTLFILLEFRGTNEQTPTRGDILH